MEKEDARLTGNSFVCEELTEKKHNDSVNLRFDNVRVQEKPMAGSSIISTSLRKTYKWDRKGLNHHEGHCFRAGPENEKNTAEGPPKNFEI